MKFKKIILTLLFFIGLGNFLTVNHTTPVKAATAQRINVPKKFRGTWYAADQNQIKTYKITKSKIVIMFFNPASNSKTYKYTQHAYKNLPKNNSKYTLIKFKGNQMYLTIPGGEGSRILLSKNHKTMYVAVNMMVTTYYKNKGLAKKNSKKDNSRTQFVKLSNKFNKEFKLKA